MFPKLRFSKRSITSVVLTFFALIFTSESFALVSQFDGLDLKRKQVSIELKLFAEGFKEITDIQNFPSKANHWVILEKTGNLYLFDQVKKKKTLIFNLKVSVRSEQGLLGIAFHPNFKKNKKFYLNYTTHEFSGRFTHISEFIWGKPPEQKRELMRVQQPYSNHNAGQIAFGPDGYLYIGMGDGGAAGDPKRHGQDITTLLGAMLRIDVDRKSAKRAYGIPKDNPFLNNSKARPELYAIGLRNPWKFSFDSSGKLWVADVGQNAWEEVSIIESGDNLGWNIVEGDACYQPARGCFKSAKKKNINLKKPHYTYSHQEGYSITGGFTVNGKKIPQIRNHYLFGDFVTGRIWAVSNQKKIIALGKFPIQMATFAKDDLGNPYVADFYKGKIYQFLPK